MLHGPELPLVWQTRAPSTRGGTPPPPPGRQPQPARQAQDRSKSPDRADRAGVRKRRKEFLKDKDFRRFEAVQGNPCPPGGRQAWVPFGGWGGLARAALRTFHCEFRRDNREGVSSCL